MRDVRSISYLAYLTAVRRSSGLDSEMAISLRVTSLDVRGRARAEETRTRGSRGVARDIMVVTGAM